MAPFYQTRAAFRQYWVDWKDRVSFRRRRWQGHEPRRPVEWASDIVPLGHGEGRWFVHAPSLRSGDICYSFGVGYDISFDRELIARFGVEVHAFDPTPRSLAWIRKQSLPAAFHFHPFGLGPRDEMREFSLPAAHNVSFSTLTGLDSSAVATCQVHRLSTIREMLRHETISMIKLDVEGTEYEIVPELVSEARRVRQLLIEFHHRLLQGPEATDQTARVIDALRMAGFRLIHRSPRGLEYVFLRSA
jgi:FkbM family methyltransferase